MSHHTQLLPSSQVLTKSSVFPLFFVLFLHDREILSFPRVQGILAFQETTGEQAQSGVERKLSWTPA